MRVRDATLENDMTRLHLILGGVLAGLLLAACGSSAPPPKDPSSDPAATMPASPENTPAPPKQPEQPSLGLGGTGTPAPQGAGAMH